ncbi:hypothetical protein RO3G_05826 [Lichtheimia corymbifera JMRC:FSU:9682]|uniref:Uncharacterized protein n=1 Tax=Lichtheimia corymbifera JMRC:FSU:9682 TaxID=1263082 RepID=A0A068SHU1_9FUNG|nr:hypothetical protein RO3G_05826 [Lichtheimia corymbifera JMRC:FSU:9682]
MNHESGEDHPNDSQLRALFAEFAKEWQSSKDAKYPLPPEVHAGLESLGSESSNELKRFQRDLVKYEAGDWTQMGAINTVFIQRLKKTTLESNAVIQQRYKDADRLRATGRAATEVYEELGNIINSNPDNELTQQLFEITGKLAKLAIFGFASAKDMDKESKNLIAKSLKLHEYIDDNSTNKTMAFSEEDVAHIREQWHQDKLIRAAIGGKRYGNQQQQWQRGRGRGRGRGNGYRSGFGTWGSRPQRSEPANHQQQQ